MCIYQAEAQRIGEKKTNLKYNYARYRNDKRKSNFIQ